MKKRTLRTIAVVMLLAAAGFLLYAFSHPEMSWPWSNSISYVIYGTYLLIMAALLVAPGGRN